MHTSKYIVRYQSAIQVLGCRTGKCQNKKQGTDQLGTPSCRLLPWISSRLSRHYLFRWIRGQWIIR